MRSPDISRYGLVAQSLHWITAALVLAAFTLGPGGSEEHVYAATRDGDRRLHETLGIMVFFISAVRLAWAAVDRRPDPALAHPWMDSASRIVQGGLYLLLFAVPLTAITGAWLENHPLTLVGGFNIIAPFAADHALGAMIAEAHGWLGDAILWLAGLHAAAAVYHHWMLGDRVLVSMLPDWLERRLPARRD
ncbi:MAG TPA: cytochrome b [Burkholderiaceae bacterium]